MSCGFWIITPTIGRQTLRRCVESVKAQMYLDFSHIVVGDGPQLDWVEEFCTDNGVQYFETKSKDAKGSYGASPRNLALDLLISRGVSTTSSYVVFLDDDNVLLEPALYQASHSIFNNENPPLLYQDILFTNKYTEEYCIFPKSDQLVIEKQWDLLNGIYRIDTLLGIKFKPVYNNDFLFTKEVVEKLGNPGWIKTKGVGGVHHLSWDTYEG